MPTWIGWRVAESVGVGSLINADRNPRLGTHHLLLGGLLPCVLCAGQTAWYQELDRIAAPPAAGDALFGR